MALTVSANTRLPVANVLPAFVVVALNVAKLLRLRR